MLWTELAFRLVSYLCLYCYFFIGKGPRYRGRRILTRRQTRPFTLLTAFIFVASSPFGTSGNGFPRLNQIPSHSWMTFVRDQWAFKPMLSATRTSADNTTEDQGNGHAISMLYHSHRKRHLSCTECDRKLRRKQYFGENKNKTSVFQKRKRVLFSVQHKS